ncbi:MAG: hypothetical protein AAFY88_22090 [Acidobacteriota bacterium]
MPRNASVDPPFRHFLARHLLACHLLALVCAGCLIVPPAAAAPVDGATRGADPLGKELLAKTAPERARVRRASEPSLEEAAGDAWLRDLGFAIPDAPDAPDDAASPLKSASAGWELLWDVDTDLPHLLQGPGLDVASLPGPEKRGPQWTRAELEPRLRAFLARMPQLAE